MSRCVAIWDIDGTLANHNHRAALLQKKCSVCLHEPMPVGHHVACPSCGGTVSTVKQESWDNFLKPELMLKDTAIPSAVRVLNLLRSKGSHIHFITGRRRSLSGEVTEKWLKQHCSWNPNKELLFMREEHLEADKDLVPASIYKERAFKRLTDQIGSDGVFLFFEDDPHVFDVYGKYGLVFQSPQVWVSLMPVSPRDTEHLWSI